MDGCLVQGLESRRAQVANRLVGKVVAGGAGGREVDRRRLVPTHFILSVQRDG